jgi:hypothetical protein
LESNEEAERRQDNDDDDDEEEEEQDNDKTGIILNQQSINSTRRCGRGNPHPDKQEDSQATAAEAQRPVLKEGRAQRRGESRKARRSCLDVALDQSQRPTTATEFFIIFDYLIAPLFNHLSIKLDYRSLAPSFLSLS